MMNPSNLLNSPDKSMGAVHVRVKLTNAIDEGLVRRGLLNPNRLRTYETVALVDTGAVRTVLPEAIAQALNLSLRGQQTARYADGREELVGVTEPVVIEIDGRQTVESALVTGDTVLIGQTVLETLDLLVDCKNQRLIPNPDHPDYPVLRV
ncbi:MAG: retroviral-like aspartic protease family protein [Oscillatoriales cyanobacterium C42_A2020_001]|nr:retroviral-like aspartic protease family protein [Leptolyngbyaceae cyanobacterium C42_A2020_001]